MTVESERGTSDNGVDAESTPTPKDTTNNSSDGFYADDHNGDSSYPRAAYSSGAYGAQSSHGDIYRGEMYNGDPYFDSSDDPVGDSPENLRTRADSLLDEMMLGAVDVSAADFSGPEASSTQYAASGYRSDYRSDGAETASYTGNNGGSPDNGGYGVFDAYSGAYEDANGKSRDTSWSSSNASRNGASADSSFGANGSGAGYGRPGNGASSEQAPSAYATGGYSSVGNGVDPVQRQNGHASEQESTPTPTPEWRVMSGGGTSESESSTWTDYVSAFRSPTALSGETSDSTQKWQPDSPADGYTRSSADVDEGRGEAERGAYTSAYAGSVTGTASSPPTDRGSESDMDRGDNLGYVSAMSVMPKGPRRSALLPRMSRFDVDALNREIADLHEEIRMLLPVGHDQAERAQHLLDKAHTIAASDPQRSAEVEYYMQQVRTIVERTRQSRRWSNLYRDRLRTYLLAWAVLATMTLTALLLSQFQIEAIMAGLFDAARDGAFMRNFAGALGSMMAGALGGAIGALLNMGKHARSQYGFFDRKYGLRGLMLPLIGALVGLVVYSLFAVVYFIAGINPSLSAVAMATPALLAFVFGFSQESLYGTTS